MFDNSSEQSSAPNSKNAHLEQQPLDECFMRREVNLLSIWESLGVVRHNATVDHSTSYTACILKVAGSLRKRREMAHRILRGRASYNALQTDDWPAPKESLRSTAQYHALVLQHRTALGDWPFSAVFGNTEIGRRCICQPKTALRLSIRNDTFFTWDVAWHAVCCVHCGACCFLYTTKALEEWSLLVCLPL